MEAVYTGDVSGDSVLPESHFADEAGNVYCRWPLWTCTGVEMPPRARDRAPDRMQERLGPLDDETRRLRWHIASLAHCDNGIPVTIDELLQAIGAGRLPVEPFHNGCFYCMTSRTTQPGQDEAMQAIEAVLRGYLAGEAEMEALRQHSQAAGFIRRAYAWLGPVSWLSAVQRLLLERMLLPFAFLDQS